MRNRTATTGQSPQDWHRRAGIDRLPERDSSRIVSVDWEKFDLGAGCPQIAWLGHASFLIVWNNLKILVDPVFSRFIGIVPRRCPVPAHWRTINPDCVFLSHAHMDHMHSGTLGWFADSDFYLPQKSIRFLGKSLREKCHGLSQDQVVEIGGISVYTVHAQHGGWRFPWQRGYQALGYVFSDGKQSVYYAGDTAHGEHFKHIGSMMGIDLALLPIGAYAPKWFLQKRHLNPEEAVAACRDLRASRMIPFHFGGYRLSLEPLHEPLPMFARHAAQHGLEWILPVGI